MNDSSTSSLMLIVQLAIYAYSAYAMQRIAAKTNTPNGWMAWIPVLNFFLILKIAGKPYWWFILMLIPLVNIVIVIVVMLAFLKALGKPGWWIILMIIPLVNLIALGYLAFSADPLKPAMAAAGMSPQQPPAPPAPPAAPPAA